MNEPLKKSLAAKSAGICKVKATRTAEETIVAAVEKPTKKSTAKAISNTATITAAPRRRVKVTLLAAPVVEEVESAPTEITAPEKATRAKKTAAKAESSSKLESAPKPRTKKNLTEITKDETKATPKPRGRPKKAVLEVSESTTEPKKPVRQTRKRTESKLESNNPTDTTVLKTTALPKKKVTFQELPEDDKENQPAPNKRVGGKKESLTTTGLRARPVRKPVTAATCKRTTAGKIETLPPRALTPKKITQVARSSTPVDSDEDELNGGKTPVRDLSQSPKRNIPSVRSVSPIKKLDFAQTLSANTTMKTSIMSPPRRLPQSPFKNSLKESPKRSEGIPVFPTLTATLGVSATGATYSQAEAPLQQSPKRGVFDHSIFSQSTAKLQRSPNKSFLSQSPVRRLFSPCKKSMVSASIHAKTKVTETAVSSYFRSSQSPIRSAKVHRMSDEELALEKAGIIDFDDSVLSIRSPVKLPKPVPVFVDEEGEAPAAAVEEDEGAIQSPATPRGPWSKAEEAQFAPTDEEDTELEIEEDDQQVDPAMASAEDSRPVTANAASYLLNSYTLRSEDDSSEDELQADETPKRPLFRGRPSLSTKTIGARLSSGLAVEVSSHLGFTPLATQLSGWLASSPEKQAKSVSQEQAVIFSPLAAEHVPGEVQVGRQGTPIQRQCVGPRQSGLRKSISTRSSLAHSISDSPVASSYFAEEMAARDVEQQVEAQASADGSGVNVDDTSTTLEKTEIELAQNLLDTNSPSVDRYDSVVEAENDLDEVLLTTGVLEEPFMTDTAILDFVNIAQEAEELASNSEEPPPSTASSEYGDENTVIITRQNEVSITNLVASEAQSSPAAYQPGTEVQAVVFQESKDLVVDFNTPIRPDLSQPRFANTVVSKVPLRPEGHISPIKNPKKRSRSLSARPGSTKKPLLDSGVFSIPKSNIVTALSPERPAQSPARSVAASTPGQVSFAVSDFGDSTLDDIEFADDSDDEINDSILSKIPSSIKSSRVSTVATPARTPLNAVGAGILHGAVVYVDVYTTEGADASGIFVDLLTQMGAKCVREWKWNPRASLAADDVENMAAHARIGITHVVYKDGGKRTFEKLRDAKGEVCCVGVAWVLE
jgi:hypothetical protein